ncbi:hypothetical protein Btru_064277, partial [Bulinus truncatus]
MTYEYFTVYSWSPSREYNILRSLGGEINLEGRPLSFTGVYYYVRIISSFRDIRSRRKVKIAIMAKMMNSFIFTVLTISSLAKASAHRDTDTTFIPAPGQHNFVHPLTHAVSRAHQAEAFSHLNMTGMLQDALSDLINIQTGLLDHSPTQKLQVLSRYLDIFKDVQSELNSPCLDDTARIITSWFMKNETWSYQFLDASGKPSPGLTLFHVNFVGDYKQCKAAQAPPSPQIGKPGFKGKYCTLLGRPPGEYVLPIGVKLGSCMPDSCNETELTQLNDKILRKMTNGSLVAGPTECHTDEREVTAATVVAITALTIILGLVLCGTLVDIIFIQRPKWLKEVEEANLLTNSVHGNQADEDDERLLGQNDKDETELLPVKSLPNISIWGQILVSFSVYTNASKALSTSQPVGSLGAVHGIRFLSMLWVMLCHVFAFGAFFFENMDMFPKLLKRWTFAVIANGFVSVDTFFTLSGLLTAYLTCQHMKKVGWKLNWGLYYFHRFWRLTPPYMLILLMVLGFQQYFGRGALWEEVQPADKDNCENYWWANLFYVNNLLKSSKMCFAHSWYLSNDMQFFFISPLLLIPFCFKIIYGLAACLIFLLVTVITTAVLSVRNEWSVSMVNDQSLSLINTWFEDYYIKPWCRLGPYVIGILTGMMLAHYKRIRLPKYAVFLGWISAIAIALAVVYGIHGDLSGERPSSVGVAAFYNSISRSAWAVCVCWVIVACVSGYGGFVNSLLSWSPFVVLGRLTYVAYLIHPSVFLIYYQNMEQVFYYTDTNV